MSHVVTQDAEVHDLEAVERACIRLGWEFKRNQQSFRWFSDGWIDDSPVPRDLFDTEEEYQRVLALSREERVAAMNQLLGRCQHAIGVPGAEYEIGLIQKVNGSYRLAFDWWGPGGLGFMQKNNPFPQAYAAELIKMTAERQGYSWEEEFLPNGVVDIRVTSWGG